MRGPLLEIKMGGAIKRSRRTASLQELQRLAEFGRLSATLLHEISNPLTTALIYLDQLDDKISPNVREAKRSIRLLRRYVEAARQQVRQESKLTDFNLRQQVNQLKRVVVPIARRANAQLIIESIPDCQIYGDPVKFQQVLANLIVNAVEAYNQDEAPYLDKPVRVRLISEEHSLTIEIHDWGQGIGPLQLTRVFDPFYTTKTSAGHGLGIGLAIVKQYVTVDFGGTISVKSSRRQGTVFTIQLPALYRPTNR
jgi:two-component system C4-dicarboxylate transport sensor histidine kinase DctB